MTAFSTERKLERYTDARAQSMISIDRNIFPYHRLIAEIYLLVLWWMLVLHGCFRWNMLMPLHAVSIYVTSHIFSCVVLIKPSHNCCFFSFVLQHRNELLESGVWRHTCWSHHRWYRHWVRSLQAKRAPATAQRESQRQDSFGVTFSH